MYNRGETNGLAILTEDQVREIYMMAKQGHHTQDEIAEMFGVSRECVSSIKRKTKWKHLWENERTET
jgi:transcriptional regulator